MGIIQEQAQRLSAAIADNEKVGTFRSRIWPELEKFLIGGPTLIGFILGIWRYAPSHPHFEIGFQSFVIFCAYLAVFTFLEIIDSLFFGSWPIVLGIGRSALALVYIVLMMKQYLEWRTGEARYYRWILRLRKHLNAT